MNLTDFRFPATLILLCIMLRPQLLRIGPKLASSFTITYSPRAIKERRQPLLVRLLASQTSIHNTNNDDNDTIFALSSGSSSGSATAVAVIRISGPESHSILANMTTTTRSKSTLPPIRKACVRNLHDGNGIPLDQALVVRFESPHSFTGQDVVEIYSHGSRAVVEGILEYLSSLTNTRMAERGEFTQRAFENGKLDLLQVEALADLLTADTSLQRQQALSQLEGNLQSLYSEWRQRLTKGLAHAEAVIDFGDDEQLDEDEVDEDVGQTNIWGFVGEQMSSLRHDMQRHLADNRKGELVREGVKIAIVGPPNAGKSSLFNLLAQREAAIVSPIAGTTRDVLELSLNLGGVKCTLSDTAGVRQVSTDVIEQEGMKRARNVAMNADIVVAMVDVVEQDKGMSVLTDVLTMIHNDEDQDSTPETQHVLLALNKLDLQDNDTTSSLIDEDITRDLGGVFTMSCETNDGIDSFLNALTATVLDRVATKDENDTTEGAIITRARHRQHVEAAVEALLRFETLSTQGTMAVDMAAEELRLATSELGRITGAVDVEDVLDVLFTDFCIGK